MSDLHRFERLLQDGERQAVALDAPTTNAAGQRSAGALRAVAAQFQVETAKRYRPRDGKTFCNIYIWDVTRALGCEIPHWLGTTGARIETTCNMLLPWLLNAGRTEGWREVDELSTGIHTAEGGPAVAIWRNPTGKPGHIALVLPDTDTSTSTRIAQAGARCLFDAPITEGFGRILSSVRFFIHE